MSRAGVLNGAEAHACVELDVFSPDEVARAVGVPRHIVLRAMESRELLPLAGTRYLSGRDVLRSAERLRAAAALLPRTTTTRLSTFAAPERVRRGPLEMAAPSVSLLCHLALGGVLLWLGVGSPSATSESPQQERSRLVFLALPGPDGGGGGGGARAPQQAARAERRGVQSVPLSVPPVSPERTLAVPRAVSAPAPVPSRIWEPGSPQSPAPLHSATLIAPVAAAFSDSRDREGTVETGRDDAVSLGSGGDRGAGTDLGAGSGSGVGSGIGDGTDGGTGGGVFRPGSGIEPPRLLREVKPHYTEDARRRGVTGEVVLEVVVRRDGTVGDLVVVRGLGAGLEQRALEAVRQWRFAPARRLGAPVDVVVEVAVEFTLR
jgi:periplasmic protein TonB